MKSELEHHLKNQRQSLDVESPDDQLIWEGIRQELKTSDLYSNSREAKGRKPWIRIRNIAAVAFIVLGLGYMIIDLAIDTGSGHISLASLNEELGLKEAQYKTLVALKMDEVHAFNSVDNMIIKELFDEIRVLDTIYQLSLADLEEMGYNEQVIQTIFDTYEKKIFLLELIILENDKNKNHERDPYVFL